MFLYILAMDIPLLLSRHMLIISPYSWEHLPCWRVNKYACSRRGPSWPQTPALQAEVLADSKEKMSADIIMLVKKNILLWLPGLNHFAYLVLILNLLNAQLSTVRAGSWSLGPRKWSWRRMGKCIDLYFLGTGGSGVRKRPPKKQREFPIRMAYQKGARGSRGRKLKTRIMKWEYKRKANVLKPNYLIHAVSQ